MIVNHPVLATLAAKARQARDVAASSSKVDKEVSSEIKVILAELDTKEVIVGELRIVLSETKRENSKKFKEELLKAGVSPAILEAAAEASQTSSEPPRASQSASRAPQSSPRAPPGLPAVSGGVKALKYCKKQLKRSILEFISGSRGSRLSGVINCCSEPPYHTRWGSG